MSIEWYHANRKQVIQRQQEKRWANPEHPRNKYSDELIKTCINKAVTSCYNKISKRDVIAELLELIGLNWTQHYTQLSRRDRQYLNWRVTFLLNTMYPFENDRWIIREGAKA